MNIGTTLGIHMLKIMSRADADWQYLTLMDGDTRYRKGIRDSKYVIDYSADAGTTWELAIVELEPDEDSIIINIDDGVLGYRHLVRDGAYVIDLALTDLGFEGIEDIDWTNIYSTETI